MRTLHQVNQFLARPQAFFNRQQQPSAETEGCPRCGATPRSLMPLALMCASCRASFGDQTWRAPITLRG
jgi:hypothetical protein